MQRKFVNKHRQKRKYTRKTEEISSFSFSKTAYGMVPLLVMFVAFMSTMVISTPFRDALTSIRFTFEPPQFSLDSPLAFLQSVLTNLTQTSVFIWAVLIAVYGAFIQSIAAFFSGVVHTSTVVQNDIGIQRDTLLNALALLDQKVVIVFVAIGHVFSVLWYFCVSTAQIITTALSATILYIAQLITAAAVSVAQFVTQVTAYIVHLGIIASIAIVHAITKVTEVIWSMIVSVTTFIATTTQHILNAIIYLIEIPFIILHAFWLQIKPYVDIFAKHIEMTGSDLSNGFTSMGKVASLLGPVKY